MDPSAWLEWGRGIEAPEQGCIAVFSFSGLPHVGFFIGVEGKSVQILGGNQSDMVKISRYARKDVVGYRLPAPQAPAAAAVARSRWKAATRSPAITLRCRPMTAQLRPAFSALDAAAARN